MQQKRTLFLESINLTSNLAMQFTNIVENFEYRLLLLELWTLIKTGMRTETHVSVKILIVHTYMYRCISRFLQIYLLPRSTSVFGYNVMRFNAV